jgi:hypothetical protein
MTLGADSTSVLFWVASAWNSTANDGMLVPRKVCELVSGAPMIPPIRPVAAASEVAALIERRFAVWTPPSTSAFELSTGRPPCELVPISRSLVSWTSRITASMNTCLRAWSSRRTTSLIARKSRPVDMTISALVGLSPITRTWPSSDAPRPPRPPAPGAGGIGTPGTPG